MLMVNYNLSNTNVEKGTSPLITFVFNSFRRSFLTSVHALFIGPASCLGLGIVSVSSLELLVVTVRLDWMYQVCVVFFIHSG